MQVCVEYSTGDRGPSSWANDAGAHEVLLQLTTSGAAQEKGRMSHWGRVCCPPGRLMQVLLECDPQPFS